MASLPSLNSDTIPVILTKQLGIQLKGDAELHLLGGMPLRPCDQIVNADVTAAASIAGFSAGDSTTLTDALTECDVGK